AAAHPAPQRRNRGAAGHRHYQRGCRGADRVGHDRAPVDTPDRGVTLMKRFNAMWTGRLMQAKNARRRRARHSEAGFTLVEILVVVTIIRLIMGPARPP